MEIRLYIDEDAMSRSLVRGLRSRGINVTTASEEGMVGQGDKEQLEYAKQNQRVFYTFNVGDFCRLHKEYVAQGKPHSGIVVVNRRRYAVGDQVRFLMNLARTKSGDEMRNQLMFLK